MKSAKAHTAKAIRNLPFQPIEVLCRLRYARRRAELILFILILPGFDMPVSAGGWSHAEGQKIDGLTVLVELKAELRFVFVDDLVEFRADDGLAEVLEVVGEPLLLDGES